jgi:hypothetical protein
VTEPYTEKFYWLALSPKALTRLEPVVLACAEEEWEDDSVKAELMNFACDIRARIQQISEGNLQR